MSYVRKYSKLMSLVLRHCPEELGLTLDDHGWVNTNNLIAAIKSRFPEFTDVMLDEVVQTNDKKRFEFDVTGTKIRACQGHSVTVDLSLQPVPPPEFLYHGTHADAVESIFKTSINKGSRHAVHLSEDKTTAAKVGSRRGKPVILGVMARTMHSDGHTFTKSTNGVWLTAFVPSKYLFIMTDSFLDK